MRQLEAWLGVQLFRRGGRGVALTREGAYFLREIGGGLDRLSAASRALRSQHRNADSLSIGVSTALATFWLLPRLGGFRQRHPGVSLSLATGHRPLDLVGEGIGLAVRHDDALPSNCESWPLFAEEVFPVAAPEYRPAQGLDSISLEGCCLIDTREPHHPHWTWREWLRRQDLTLPRAHSSLSLDDHALALQAALAGQGICLAWRHLCGDLLAAGRLIQIGDRRLITGKHYHLVMPSRPQVNAATLLLRDWILAQAKQTSGRASAT
ncbi:MAG: LysR substrate-binding domain-containing protein [Rhodospirillales bacterium]